MGRKVHPYGFRVGIYKDWQSKWFAEKNYTELVAEDLKLRNLILEEQTEAGISQVLVDRNANQITLTIRTAKPGIVIGRGGQNAEVLREKPELYAANKDKKTKLGVSLAKCIKTGMDNK